ncbi:MAG: hypothetical protein IPK72_02945 [Candidatus Eisenbacteria bacterium]|nr:hypothetical protein [Candidatus Eisenbacteria bacterium]
MSKDRKRREGAAWDDTPRRAGTKERFIEKRQNWQDYLDLTGDEDGGDDDLNDEDGSETVGLHGDAPAASDDEPKSDR